MGKLLAQALDLPFIDLDVEIEKQEGKAIKEIFNTVGEDYFRTVESTTLQQWAGSDKNFVMATGGGAPCFHDGITVINNAGVSVFLDTPINEIVSRIQTDTNRPLLVASPGIELETKLQGIRKNRLGCYQQAKISITDSNPDTVLRELKFKM